MLKNFIIIALRNLRRQRIYSIINIGGLALGIACSVLLGLYVHTEFSFDKFHENADNIIIAHLEYGMGDGTKQSVELTPTALLPTMVDKFPEVKRGTRLFYPGLFKPPVVSYNEIAFQETGFCYADSAFFNIFSFPLIEGDARSVLAKPENIVLTESMKIKYFADEEAMGKVIQVEAKSFVVAGIMKDIPANSSIQLDFVAPFSGYWKRDPIWGSANYTTYIELNEPVSPDILASKVQSELRILGISDPQNNQYLGFGFTPLLDVHLYSDVHPGGDIGSLYIFTTISLLILLIAIINYTNLATARSFYRAKEVGLRKSLGAQKGSVIMQLIGESFVTTSVAMVIALLLVYFLLPLFSSLSGTTIPVGYFNDPLIIIGIILLYLIIAVLAGIYPALKMAGFNPADILKGSYKGTGRGVLLRKSLIVGQFFISITLIITTVIIYNQLDYINKKELGYSKDNTLVVPVSKSILEKAGEFKTQLRASAYVNDVTIASETTINIQGGYSININDGTSLGVVAAAVDESYISAMEMKLVAGRSINHTDMERCRETEEYSFILNQSAVEQLGWDPNGAIGKNVELNGRKGQVVGVVEDFHFRPFYEPVLQLVLFTEASWAYNYAMIKINGDNIPEAISAVNAGWTSIENEVPFSYKFLDADFDHLHSVTSRSANLLTTFSLLAIIIASLGLFGIVSFSMVQRSKEIGIRKVLGASTGSILMMTYQEFLILIIFSFLGAVPVSYYAMDFWLGGFAYHIDIEVWPMLLGLIATIIIAIVTISFESLKAALLNPAETLRNE